MHLQVANLEPLFSFIPTLYCGSVTCSFSLILLCRPHHTFEVPLYKLGVPFVCPGCFSGYHLDSYGSKRLHVARTEASNKAMVVRHRAQRPRPVKE